jgi:hypothetical protein
MNRRVEPLACEQARTLDARMESIPVEVIKASSPTRCSEHTGRTLDARMEAPILKKLVTPATGFGVISTAGVANTCPQSPSAIVSNTCARGLTVLDTEIADKKTRPSARLQDVATLHHLHEA